MSDTIFNLQDVTLTLGENTVLHHISLMVQRGEVLVIIGPSGSGKSSLLRCLNRMETIDSGTITYNGRNLHDLSILDLRREVGMVFQKVAVFDGTVADNIAFGPQLRGETLSRDQIFSLMAQASLDDKLIDRDAHDLSGGQEQRLAIARALANRPKALLVDEPTSALDPVITHRVEEILLKLRDDAGLTLIWVSHDVEQARRIADRVLMLEHGQVMRCDTVEAMLDPETGDPHVLAFARGLEDDNSEM